MAEKDCEVLGSERSSHRAVRVRAEWRQRCAAVTRFPPVATGAVDRACDDLSVDEVGAKSQAGRARCREMTTGQLADRSGDDGSLWHFRPDGAAPAVTARDRTRGRVCVREEK